MDWRTLEKIIVRYFEREGPARPRICAECDSPMNGEWVLPYGKGRINLSALAREIEAEVALHA